MIRYMLDTNIVIYTLNNRPRQVRDHFIAHDGQMCVSSVTMMELYFSAEKSSNPDRNIAEIEQFAARLDIFDYDTLAAAHTGQIRNELRRSGKNISPYDQMIAGHARSAGLIVVTNNVSEFSRVSGLRIENWAQ